MASEQYCVFKVSTKDGSFVTLELPDYAAFLPSVPILLWFVRILTRHPFVQETDSNEPNFFLFCYSNCS